MTRLRCLYHNTTVCLDKRVGNLGSLTVIQGPGFLDTESSTSEISKEP